MKIGSIVSLAAVAALALGTIGSYVSYSNYGNRSEMTIKARYADNENVYANGTQKVIEIAQVPEMYKNDIKEVFAGAMTGRYGANGSQAMFQMLKEQNPTIDSAMYTKIQQVMESFRNEFKNAQTALLDQCRSYETARGNVWGGFWLSLTGYPKLDIDKMCTIVSTDKAAETFRTKRDSGIKLR